MKKVNRREFIKAGLGTSALLFGGIALPARALASGPTCAPGGSFRAMVSIELLGGIDNFIFSIPTDNARKNALIARRPSLTGYYDNPDLVHLGYGSNIALHPGLKPLEPYLSNLRLTMGLTNTLHVSPSLSHEVAQARMSLGTTQSALSGSGWKGRLYDSGANLIGFLGSKSHNFNCDTCTASPPLVSENYENYKVSGSNFHSSQGGGNNANHVASVIEQLATMPLSRPVSELEARYRSAQNSMFASISQLQNIVSGYQTPKYDEYMVGSGSYNEIAQRFRNIAQTLLYLKCENSSERVIFVVPHGSYDVHADFNFRMNSLMGDLGGVLATFIEDLKAMNIFEQVVITTETDFGRRLHANSAAGTAGTDHGTGFNALTIGGKVNGGANSVYGDMLSAAQLQSANLWTPEFDARTLLSEIIEKHLQLDPLQTAFPGQIANEFARFNMSLFSSQQVS